MLKVQGLEPGLDEYPNISHLCGLCNDRGQTFGSHRWEEDMRDKEFLTVRFLSFPHNSAPPLSFQKAALYNI